MVSTNATTAHVQRKKKFRKKMKKIYTIYIYYSWFGNLTRFCHHFMPFTHFLSILEGGFTRFTLSPNITTGFLSFFRIFPISILFPKSMQYTSIVFFCPGWPVHKRCKFVNGFWETYRESNEMGWDSRTRDLKCQTGNAGHRDSGH